MGYSGFGLQNWIFTQKARRPFSRDRKPAGECSDYRHDNKYAENIFSSKSKNHDLTPEDSKRASKRLERKMKDLGHFLLLKRIVVGIFVVLGISLTIILIRNSKSSNERNQTMRKAMAQSSYKDAISQFEKGKYESAYVKFEKAIYYDSNLFSAYHGLTLTYGQLCNENEAFCVKTLKIIKLIEKKFPDKDISDLKEIESSIRMKLQIN
jgi:hypothetical protein